MLKFNSNKQAEIGNDAYLHIVLYSSKKNRTSIPFQATQNSVYPISILKSIAFQFRKKDCRNAQF